MADKNLWPPEQLKTFTPLLLVHYQGHRTPEQVAAMAGLMYSGDIGEVGSLTSKRLTIEDNNEKLHKILDASTPTKEIEEILIPLENNEEPCFILIEGAPGIGKSVLLKEIAYRWGKKSLLQDFELVLLICLRDPSLQKIQSVDDLLQLFCIGDKNAAEIVSACSKYLFANGGKSLVLLLDGYDEYPSNLQESSLIADILKRQVLPFCGLVVSSRPHASEHFHQQATIRVDILGFTETEREHYIKQALPDQPNKVKELTQYLHQQPSVDSICFIPFNIAILLYLFKLGISLPKNSTELFHHFICSTVCRHLSKFGIPLTHSITDLTNLPDPYNGIIKQLSRLSLEALNTNKLIFTLDEIAEACPSITTIPGAINGFGLLQAVHHFGLYAKTITLSFIHFTVQEFLAAHYISHLLPNEELKVIKATFWNNIHFNMYSIYMSLTKGQRPSFKQFLSGGNNTIVISDEFLKDQLKLFRLYHCFKEADDCKMCDTIERADIFQDKIIDLGGTTLAASDMECISLFLTSSFTKEWVRLYLNSCYIQDKGLDILYRGLQHSAGIRINQLYLGDNGLTTKSSSLISKLTVKCKVKILLINGNYNIGEDQQLYSMLTNPFNALEQLYMHYTRLSSRAAITLFTALKDNNKLKVLNVHYNVITDDACNAITAVLERSNCLVSIGLYHNPLSIEAIMNIVQCLEGNNTLQVLGLPKCLKDIQEYIKSLGEVVNKRREGRGNEIKLEIKFMNISTTH